MQRVSRLTAPYYQMDLRPTSYSDQHPMLLDLESKGNEVYYVAPVFHLLTELNQAYIRKQVVKRSRFVRPSIIGILPDAKSHSWAFDELGNACLFSEPRPTEAPIDSEQFSRHLLFQFRERGSVAISQSALSKLEEHLISIISQRLGEGEQILGFGALQERLSPLERISYLARMFLDCAFFVIREK